MKQVKIVIIIAAYSVSCRTSETVEIKSSAIIPDSILSAVETVPATMQEMVETIKLNGKIQADETKSAKVYALVSGKVQSVKVELGDYVHRGQMLAELQSTEVAAFTHDISLARANMQLADKNLQRMKDLYEGNLATQQEYTLAQVEYNKAMADLHKAQQVARITGGRQSSYVITAPLTGYVIEKNLTSNSEIRQDNNTNLFTVADLSTVWIIANVYESDIRNIRLGDTVEVSTLTLPDKIYRGRIDKVYNVLDPVSRTMKVRISMANQFGELKPEMFATVKVKGHSTGEASLCIPSKALVLDNSRYYVVVKDKSGLSAREVRLIRRLDDLSFIEGLREGDKVVTNSQVFLYEALLTK